MGNGIDLCKPKERIHSKMSHLKVQKILLQDEREYLILKYFELTGEMISRKPIPNYLADNNNIFTNNTQLHSPRNQSQKISEKSIDKINEKS